MVFRNYRINIIIRILLFVVLITALVYCLMASLYLRSIYVGLALIISVFEFIRYTEKTNRDLTALLLTISQSDFTTTYSEKGKGKSFRELYKIFNEITNKFRTISEEKEAQFRFLSLLVEHVRVGILSFDTHGNIHLINESMKRFLTHPYAHNLKALEHDNHDLVEALRTINVGENKMIKIVNNGKIVSLTLHAAEFTLQRTYYKLISAQDIRNELEAKELEAWQKLIRVLTHEIMNSISPVMSLSDTLHKLVVQRNSANKSLAEKDRKDLEQGLNAIRSRSEALQSFTNAYKSLTRIPQPNIRQVKLSDMMERIHTLFTNEISKMKIEWRTKVGDHSIVADPDLMEQVMINLLKNSIEALQLTSRPKISIEAEQDSLGKTLLLTNDNGSGIAGDVLDKIFIPFYTTKNSGSGIGLALSKQIIQLHRGRISIDSSPGMGTTVKIWI